MVISKYNFEIPYDGKLIVFNTVKNAYAIFECDDYANLKNATEEYLANEYDQDKVDGLVESGFIIADPECERKHIRQEYLQKIFNSSMYTATIIPTNTCNLACPYCFAPRSNETMTEDTVNRTIDFFQDTFDERGQYIKYFNIEWFGGEPLLHYRAIQKITQEVLRMCGEGAIEYHAKLYTNLTMLDKAICTVLRQANLTEVQTTIDGFRDLNDQKRPAKNGGRYFDRLIENVKRISEFSKISIMTNIDANETDTVFDLIDYLLDNDIVDGENVTIHFNLINDNEHISDKSSLIGYGSDKANEMIEQYLNRLGDKAALRLPTLGISCFAMAHNSVVITPEGSLHKCALTKPYGSLYHSNINVDSLFFFQAHDPFLRQGCTNCSVFPICYGGCTNDGGTLCITKHMLGTQIKRYFKHIYRLAGDA